MPAVSARGVGGLSGETTQQPGGGSPGVYLEERGAGDGVSGGGVLAGALG